MLYEIACNSDFQGQLREEICAIPNPSFDQLDNDLPLLDAALKETLRLHPALLENHHEVCPFRNCCRCWISNLNRKAGETIRIPLSEPIAETGERQLIIPKGTTVVIPVNVLQRDKELWGKDAESFRPGRWLESERGGFLKTQELLAFGAG